MKVISLNDLVPVRGGPPITRQKAEKIHALYCILYGYTELSEILAQGGFPQVVISTLESDDFEEIKRLTNWYAEVLL